MRRERKDGMRGLFLNLLNHVEHIEACQQVQGFPFGCMTPAQMQISPSREG